MFYKRLEKIIGKNNIENIKNKKVLIVGLGGVGGSSFEALVRSGIGTIYVCDFDIFEETNLNRQILSNLNNIGIKKTDAAETFANNINKECRVIKINEKLTSENIEDILPNDIHFIIDACDDINVKIKLVKFAIKNNITIISSMGTGNKLKPEMLEITNVWKTEYDPLAKKMRYLLKKEGISYKLPVVSSKERPIVNDNTMIGSFAPVTNCAGLLLASYVLNKIIEFK